MIFINILIVLLNLNNFVNSLYLSSYQMKLINNLIKNNKINDYERNKINFILFDAYKYFSIKKAIEFKNKHKYKCKNINDDELFLSSEIGLFKAIKNYNGKNSLVNYSTIYINSELCKLLTDKYSLSIIPKSYRIKNKSTLSKSELHHYKKILNIKLGYLYENWQLESLFFKNENILNNICIKNEYNELLSKLLDKLTPSMKRILYLKYYSNDNKIVSNKKISILMCCSEEAIRKQLCLIKKMANNIYLEKTT